MPGVDFPCTRSLAGSGPGVSGLRIPIPASALTCCTDSGTARSHPPRLPFPKIPFLFPGPLAQRFSLSQASQLLPLPPYRDTSPFAPSFPALSRCISHSKQPENLLAEALGSAPAPALSLQGTAGPQPAAEGREAAAPQGWGSFAHTEIKQQSFGFLQSWLQESWSMATVSGKPRMWRGCCTHQPPLPQALTLAHTALFSCNSLGCFLPL